MKEKDSKKHKEESPVAVLTRLVLITIFAVGSFFFLVEEWQPWFNSYYKMLDQRHPLGFSVLFIFAATSHTLVWGVPSAVAASLVKDYVKCIGALFYYSLGVTLIIAIIQFVLMSFFAASSNGYGFGIVNAERNIKVAAEVLQATVSLDLVNVLMSPQSSGTFIAATVLAYFLYVTHITWYLRNIFLPEKDFKFSIGAFLVLIVTFLISFSYFALTPFVGDRLILPLYKLDFWKMEGTVHWFFILRAIINWTAFMFAIVVMKTIFPEREEVVIEVAAPVLRSPGQTRS